MTTWIKRALVVNALILLWRGNGSRALPVQYAGVQDPAQEQQSPPQRVRVSQGVAQGLILKKVQPKYPKKARNKGIQGTVVLHAMISKEGDIASLELISGDPLLAPAAMEAVRQWKYRPYLLQGSPVAVETEILVNFTLTRH